VEEDVVSGLFWCRLWFITATAAEESGWVYVYRAVVDFVEQPQVVLI